MPHVRKVICFWTHNLDSHPHIFPEPEFVNLLRSQGVDSQPGGPVRQPYMTYRPARLQRLAESIPWNRFLGFLKVYKSGLRFLYSVPPSISACILHVIVYVCIMLPNIQDALGRVHERVDNHELYASVKFKNFVSFFALFSKPNVCHVPASSFSHFKAKSSSDRWTFL